jgi:phage terminase small subunit
MSLPKPPTGLSRRSARLWRQVTEEFELSAAELELLRSGLVALDRADEAARVLASEGLTISDRYGGCKAHPLLDVESRNRTLFSRIVAQLGVKATVETVRRSGGKTGPRPKATPLRRVGG